MNKLSRFTSAALLSTALLTTTTPVLTNTVNASAVEAPTNKNSQAKTLDKETVSKIDPYVSVKNNQYVLDSSVKDVISQEDYVTAETLISQTNNFIQKSDMVINKQTKVATNDFSLTDDNLSVETNSTSLLAKPRRRNHNGVNSISVHWNYVHICIDKSTANKLKRGSMTLAAYFSEKIPDKRIKLVALFVSGVLASTSIKRGIWFDINFWATGLSRWGWQ